MKDQLLTRELDLDTAHSVVMGLLVERAEDGDSEAAILLPMSNWATRRRYILSRLTQAMNYRLWLGGPLRRHGNRGDVVILRSQAIR